MNSPVMSNNNSGKDYQVDVFLPSSSCSTFSSESILAMSPKFTMKNFIKHTYHHIDEKMDPYDEPYSVKALFDEASSDASSSETLLGSRKPARHYYGLFFAFNIILFSLSAMLFLVSGYRLIELRDPLDNGVLRRSSEHCE